MALKISTRLYTIVERPQQEAYHDVSSCPSFASRSSSTSSTSTVSESSSCSSETSYSSIPTPDPQTPLSPCELTLAKRTMQMFLNQELEIKRLHQIIDKTGRTLDAPEQILTSMVTHHNISLPSLARQIEIRLHNIFASCYTARGAPRPHQTSTLFANRIHAQFKPLIHAVDRIRRSAQAGALELALYLGLEIAKFGFKIAVASAGQCGCSIVQMIQ
ncbi:hypothetical protein BS50DRAFT_672519 [Corynespora cassiicola Philippines]|uniref:Uncharacterized protein n=1 Tax=Corynespora cassiicola Philippines TaxID=1448308 RepID=A0A2T2P7Q9_CORCC|nr:hypothetical protein BS50DRAFT_672519 [Corynespora cassiicola Philippines]